MPELWCNECNRFIHSEKYSDKILIGDSFYIYTCPTCSNSNEKFERLPMSWANLIQLVLYHLWMGGERKHRYFRWKEDICGLIEEKWDDLIPNKTKSNSWYNSVSSVLSSNDRIFASGVAIKGAPGWWALHHWEPPSPPVKLTLKRSRSDLNGNDEEILISSEEDDELDVKKPINITESQSENEKYEDLIVDESDSDDFEAKPEESTSVNAASANAAVNADNHIDNHIDNVTDNIDHPVVPSADLKQQLLERLLMMDSSLLQDAIKKAKAKKLAEIESNNNSSNSSGKKKTKTSEKTEKSEKVAEKSADKSADNVINLVEESAVAPSVVQEVFKVPDDCLKSMEPFIKPLTERLSLIPVIRASPYENDLLKKCNRVNYQENKTAARLRRKLLLRRQRRKVNCGLFDLDQWMYLYLKSPESALVTLSEPTEKVEKAENVVEKPISFPLTFDPHSIPYIADPSKSLYAKLTGMAAIYGTCPYPVTSPFSGKLLPEIIEEDEHCQVPKLKLLNELRSKFIKEAEAEVEVVQVDEESCVVHDQLLKPTNIIKSHPDQHPCDPLTIKYTNLRKEFVGQLNDLLVDSFWPGIEVSEALDYPEYAIVALVGLSVVGCAICNPDGYLSYLYVRPDFQGHQISLKMLSLLFPLLSTRKDITLHVSVTNTPAMLLYQKIGFKPEEYVVNFYDKFIGIDESASSTAIGSKNAFFMRLRR